MRNLRAIHRSLIKCQHLATVCWDINTDSVICAFGPLKDNALLELKRWKKYGKICQLIASWDAPCPSPDLDHDEILDIHYFSDTLTVCLVLAGGDLIVVREDPQDGEEKIEIVGSVDAGISAAAWSPDEELLAITTQASTLLYMTREFENMVDVAFVSDDLKASNQVSVGWGKKETQFKGKKARVLRDPTMPESIDEGVVHHLDARNTTISWRGDGSYLAVNSIESDKRRVVRVYSREGQLDSVSEPVDSLVGALSWRPAGNIIAGIQRLENAVRVVFFERNGLRHGQFDLRLNEYEMAGWASDISLKWNIDSSVLAVCFKDRVQLWTMGNYHYYLKQEILGLSRSSHSRPVGISWHPEKPLHFALCSEGGAQRLVYASTMIRSPTAAPNDYGIVATIDGKTLKVTPMRVANVPPPMALHEIGLDFNVADVTITCRNSEQNMVLLAVLHLQGISLFKWNVKDIGRKGPSLEWQVGLVEASPMQYSMYLQATFGGRSTVNVLENSVDGWFLRLFDVRNGDVEETFTAIGRQVDGLVTHGFGEGPDARCIVKRQQSTNAEKDDKCLEDSATKHQISFQESSTQILESVICGFVKARPACGPLSSEENISKDEPAINGHGLHDEQISFHLDESGCLSAGERPLVKNCTSFLVTPAHLIFTTSQHLLKFVHLQRQREHLEIPPDTPESDERCRSVERGARLVTVMPSIFALVLQMPRGNLETIYPRALVLAGIRDSINRKKYRKAFLACRNHRVDMNILHDHAPAEFLADVGLFIDQVKKVEHIDLFLSQLREENVSKNMYKETLESDPFSQILPEEETANVHLPSKSKVNHVCDRFLAVLRDRSQVYLQNIVTAHVCKAPPDLDAGLSQIANLRKQNSHQVDAAVEHICFLADVNRLYDNALGLYDLQIALLIAQKSQKDPREYIPFLQGLQQMPELRRQFSINNFLGRHAKALRNLCDIDAFEEVKSYAVKCSLYSQALEYYRYQDARLAEVMRLYADNLQQGGKFKDAGIAFEFLRDYSAASESFRQAHQWRESLSNASMDSLAHADTHIHSLALSLADTLTESRDFHSAATIHLDYLSDVPAAARLFCKGYHFADALRIVTLHRRLDLLESIIDVGLLEGMANMTELLADCKSQLHAQIPRIRELRIKKAEDPLAFWDGDIPGSADVPDNVSIAPTDASTTGGSLFTRYTNRTGTVGTNATRRTSKNRRRDERKRARGKKGSVYEEEYLVNSIGRLIERINAVGDEVSRLVIGLMRRGMRERARAVEVAMVEVVDICKGCREEIFPSLKAAGKVDAGLGETEIDNHGPEGGDGVFLDGLGISNKPPEAPEIKDFHKLSLLGG